MSLQDAVEIAKELVRIARVIAAEQHRVELLESPPAVRYRRVLIDDQHHRLYLQQS